MTTSSNISSRDRTVLVGIDCATDAKNVGVARALFAGGRVQLESVATFPSWAEIESSVAAWLSESVLLAVDAPLGWPRPLGELLATHRAGDAVRDTAHAMFRRVTDDVIAEQIGKRSLDVGADRIARTAHAALTFITDLRLQAGEALPLAWVPGPVMQSSVIEVYPAATLAGRGWPSSGYKGKTEDAVEARRVIIGRLKDHVAFDEAVATKMTESDHLLDAALCILAAADFTRGEVIAPTDRRRAEQEGWIWVRPSLADVS